MHDIDNMTDEELAKCFVNILKEYVDTFYDQVTSTCKIKGKGIMARFSTEAYGQNDFYMDYSCIYPSYSKDDAKKALNIFKKYSDLITMYLDILRMKYPDIDYMIDKTQVSSSRIGKELYVSNLPFSLPKYYYEKV